MKRPLTKNIIANQMPFDLVAYERAGGYQTVRQSLGKVDPAVILAAVVDSGLGGCGGGGFPTGRKWQAMPSVKARPGPRYFIVNADEMEPGTFKDRLLLEGDPHQL
ncbi:MAG: NADH-quinone oxidoreductase subunit F, partial [Acidocella sp.]|nr:NADH-quinone oxidoreductase subunit F [Acidocella sp.]